MIKLYIRTVYSVPGTRSVADQWSVDIRLEPVLTGRTRYPVRTRALSDCASIVNICAVERSENIFSVIV